MAKGTKLQLRLLFISMNEHQLCVLPEKNDAGQRYSTLPTIAKVTAVEYIGMSREECPIAKNDEIVQVGKLTAPDFVSTRHIARSIWIRARGGQAVVMLFRSPVTGKVYQKYLTPDLTYDKGPSAMVYVQLMKVDTFANVYLKGLYFNVIEERNKNVVGYCNEYGQRFSNLRTIAKSRQMFITPSPSEVSSHLGLADAGEIVQIDELTAKDFRSAHQVKKCIIERAKSGVRLFFRNPYTGAMIVKKFRSSKSDRRTPYVTLDLQIMKFDSKSKHLYVQFNKHQLETEPHFRKWAISLPPMATVTELQRVSFAAHQHDPIALGAEVIQIAKRNGYQFQTTQQMSTAIEKLARGGVELMFRNRMTGKINRKIARRHLIAGPSPYVALKLRMQRIDKVAQLRHKGLFIRTWENSQPPISDAARARFETLCPIGIVTSVSGMRQGELGKILEGADIIEINNFTARHFFSAHQTATVICKQANRGVQLVLRDRCTGALYIKTFYSERLSTRLPHTVVKFRIREFKKSVIQVKRLFVQYDRNETRSKPSFENVNGIPLASLQPMGVISSIRYKAMQSGAICMGLGDEIIQIGNLTAANFRRTSQISHAISKRAKRGIDIIVRNPETGQLDCKIFQTRLSYNASPYAVVNLQLEMPALRPIEPFVRLAGCTCEIAQRD